MQENLLKLLNKFLTPRDLKIAKRSASQREASLCLRLALPNKHVLVRVDFNVPLNHTKISKNGLWKIESVLPTLNYLIEKKAKIILITHLGRPNGKIVKNLRLNLIKLKLEKLLKKKVWKLDNVVGKKVQEAVGEMKPADIIMLENIRFYPEEEKNSPKFIKELAKLGDIFVNEAFAVSHRKHASIVGIPKYLPSVVGLLFHKEIKGLDKVLYKPKRPFVVIIGGLKVSTKIKVIEKFLKKADKLLLGSALSDTIFAANGMELGKSFIEKDMFKVVRKLDLENPKLLLPVDFVCQNLETSLKSINAVKKDESVFDHWG